MSASENTLVISVPLRESLFENKLSAVGIARYNIAKGEEIQDPYLLKKKESHRESGKCSFCGEIVSLIC